MDPMEKERALFNQIMSETMMTEEEQRGFLKKFEQEGWLLACEDRQYPLHDVLCFPARWLERENLLSFVGNARPGECYAFQLALYSDSGLDQVSIRCGGFGGEVHCINGGGTDCLGNPLHKTISSQPERVQPLWFYFMIPEDFQGSLEGSICVTPSGKAGRCVSVLLHVEGEPIAEHGDCEPWRHSRLRWLDSTIAMDDGLTQPFTPLRTEKNAIQGLGHRLFLTEDGLPKQVQSCFSPSVDRISRTSRDILSSPAEFQIFSPGIQEITQPAAITEQKEGIVRWKSERTAGALTVSIEGSMEYDGYCEYRVTIDAREDTPVENFLLRLPYSRDAAKYWMGLGEMGGFRKKDLDWKWNSKYNQDTLWMGDVNAGLMLRLKDREYEKPYLLIYYHYHPLKMPRGWDNGGKGGVRVIERGDSVELEAYSGSLFLKKGERVTFDFDLSITPVKPINKQEHWHDHYYHDVPRALSEVSAGGANVINIHHAKEPNPYINYPFFEAENLANYVNQCHDNGLRVKIYYTVKEMTVHMVEFWALQSLGDEVFPSSWETGESFQGKLPFADEWLEKYLKEGYMTAWRQKIDDGKYHDELEISVLTAPMSRFNNYFLEGLDWLLKHTGIDGLYFDDVAFDRTVMKRIRKLLDRDHPGCTLDLHSWNYYRNNTKDDSSLAGWGNSMNLYIDNLAFLDRLWFGECFDYDVSPDTWLVEMSGIPFGLMGEMLQDGGNIWRGMVYGMTNRLPNPKDPTGLWAFWDWFRMADAVQLGWWNPGCPVKTGCSNVAATVYRQAHRSMVALASWSPEDEESKLEIDYCALGLDPSQIEISIPEIPGFQQKQETADFPRLSVPAGKGWILLLSQKGSN